jgi:hypothetical protein
MKISKSQLRQIIKEELSENEWYDDEHETRADRKYADRPSEFTNYLLQMYQDLSETADIATIREIIQDNFNSALEAAESAFLGD